MIAKRPLAVAITLAMLSASSVAVIAQDAVSPAAPAAVEVDDDAADDNGFDLGWLGLLGLFGLLGLRGRKHDDHVRTTNTRTH